MNLKIEKPTSSGYWKSALVVILIATALILWPKFVPSPGLPLAFEIAGFEGDAQIYDLQNQTWRTPKRGEEFSASQKLKTGSDGIINFKVENELHLRLKENSELENLASQKRGEKEIYKLHLKQGVLLGATTKQFDREQAAGTAILRITTSDYITDIHGAIFRIQAALQQGDADKVGVLRGSAEVSKPIPFFKPAGIRIRGLENVHITDGVIPPAERVTQAEWSAMKEAYELIEKTAVKEAEQIDLSKQAGSFFNYVFDHGTFYTPKSGYAGREFYKDPEAGKVFLETEYDVFPAGSFVGVYIKVRDFDASKYSGLALDIRRKPDEGTPESFMIELKSKGNVVRRFAPRGFERDWKTMTFDFHAKTELLVNEVVFVFTNARVGEAKKGILEFRNLDLIPLPKAAEVSKAQAETTPAATPVTPSQVSASEPTPAPATATTASPSQIPVPKEIPLQ